MEANKIELKALIISIATIASIEVATSVVISKGLCDPMLILGAARALEALLIVLIVMIWGKGISCIGLARSTIFLGLGKGLIWSVGFGILAFLAFVILFAVGINPLALIRVHLPTRSSQIALFFLIGGVVGPVAEELFFRGMLYGFFRRWGVVLAVVLSTLIFVLTHPTDHGLPITQAIGGVVFALAYEVEGSLMVPITIHSLGNMAMFAVSLIA